MSSAKKAPVKAISTLALAKKFHVGSKRVIEVLASAGVKPKAVGNGEIRVRQLWPINASKRAVREFVAANPPKVYKNGRPSVRKDPKATVRVPVRGSTGVDTETVKQLTIIAESINNQLAALTKLVASSGKR